jgi:hypothetical protein
MPDLRKNNPLSEILDVTPAEDNDLTFFKQPGDYISDTVIFGTRLLRF